MQISPFSGLTCFAALAKNRFNSSLDLPMFDFPPTCGKLKITRSNILEPNVRERSVASTSCRTSTFSKDDNFSIFCKAKSLFANAGTESSDVAMILTDVCDNAEARQRVNEKFPSPTTNTSFEYKSGSSKAIIKAHYQLAFLGIRSFCIAAILKSRFQSNWTAVSFIDPVFASLTFVERLVVFVVFYMGGWVKSIPFHVFKRHFTSISLIKFRLVMATRRSTFAGGEKEADSRVRSLTDTAFLKSPKKNCSCLELVRETIPALTECAHKGQMGRIGVIGGCQE